MEQDELFNISDEQLSDLEKTASDLDSGVKSEAESVQNSEPFKCSETFPFFYCALRMCDVVDYIEELERIARKGK